jgi:hypothetical protein
MTEKGGLKSAKAVGESVVLIDGANVLEDQIGINAVD